MCNILTIRPMQVKPNLVFMTLIRNCRSWILDSLPVELGLAGLQLLAEFQIP